MALRFQKNRHNKKKDNAETLKPQRAVEKRTVNGSIVVVNEIGGLRGSNIADHRHAGSLLARVFNLARKISPGIAGGAAAGVAANRPRLLCAGSHGAARPTRKTLDRPLWPRPGVHLHRTDSRLGAVQLSICSATSYRFVCGSRSKIAGRFGCLRRGKLTD